MPVCRFPSPLVIIETVKRRKRSGRSAKGFMIIKGVLFFMCVQNQNASPKKVGTYDIVAVGLMAALCFAAIYIKIDIPTPMGKTMIHLGNTVCLLSGMLLGGLRGGLAAGVGTMFYDLTDPAFVAGAPFTFLFKFIMAFIAGVVSRSGGAEGKSLPKNITGCVLGEVAYIILYLGKSFISSYYLQKNALEAVMGSLVTKLMSSTINAVIAIVASILLLPAFITVMKKSGVYGKIFPPKPVSEI